MTKEEYQKILDKVQWNFRYAEGDAYYEAEKTFDLAFNTARGNPELMDMFLTKQTEVNNKMNRAYS